MASRRCPLSTLRSSSEYPCRVEKTAIYLAHCGVLVDLLVEHDEAFFLLSCSSAEYEGTRHTRDTASQDCSAESRPSSPATVSVISSSPFFAGDRLGMLAVPR